MLYPICIGYISDRQKCYSSTLSPYLTELLTGVRLSGKLYIIATPIGNLGDLSTRVRQAIEDSDVLLCEDTRVTIKLLYHLGVKRRMVSCHKFNEAQRQELIKDAAEHDQTVALISDAGTPLISDPGERIVNMAIDSGMTVIPIPGPTALIQALVASGLPCERFVFEGFLPDKSKALRSHLMALMNDERTLVFYIPPHGISKRLSIFQEVLGDRRICLARELTKLNEQYIRCRFSEVGNYLNEENTRGEFTLVVEGAPPRDPSEDDLGRKEEMEAYITELLAKGAKTKEVTTICHEKFGIKKSDVYDLVLRLRNEQD